MKEKKHLIAANFIKSLFLVGLLFIAMVNKGDWHSFSFAKQFDKHNIPYGGFGLVLLTGESVGMFHGH